MPQNPTRQVHALLAGFVQDALIDNQNHRHKTDKIIARTFAFYKWQKSSFSASAIPTWKTPCQNTDFYKTLKTLRSHHTTWKNDERILLTKNRLDRLCKLTRNFAKRKQADFENLQNQLWLLLKETDTTFQNQSWPKRKLKTLKPILATRQNQPETLLMKKNLLNEKDKLENLLAENQTQTKLKKNATAKKWIWFSELNDKTNLANQRRFCICSLALPANGLRYLRWGGGRRSRPTRKMIRRVKLLGMCAESPASGAGFVGRLCARLADSKPKPTP